MTSVFGGKKADLEVYRALGIKANQMCNDLTSVYSFNVVNTGQMSDCKRILFQVSRFWNRIWKLFCSLLGALWSVPLAKYYSDDQIKKYEMGGSCDTYGGEEKCVKVFWRIESIFVFLTYLFGMRIALLSSVGCLALPYSSTLSH